MADVEKININSTDYDIADAKALRNKDVNASSFIDTKAGTTTYPTDNVNLSDSIIIGQGAYHTNSTGGTKNVIIGNNAYGGASYQTAVGESAHCSTNSVNDYATALGYNAYAGTKYSVSIGANSKVQNNNSVAVGDGAQSNTSYSVAIGKNALNSGNSYGVALGADASTAAQYATSVGGSTSAQAIRSTCLGYSSGASQHYATAIGAGAYAQASYATQIGNGINNSSGTLQFRSWQLVDNNGKIPIERLPEGIDITGINPPDLYNWDTYQENDDKVNQEVYLWTGETNSLFTKDQFYKGVVSYSKPYAKCSWVNSDYVTSQKDVIIDQDKLYQKLAEISQDRIDNGDTANSIVGGDNSNQDMYFYYNGDEQQWYIEFGSSSFESGDNDSPDDYYFASGETLADFGIYINESALNLPTDDSDEEIFDVEYDAPNYCDSFSTNEYGGFTINYMKFMSAMCDSDWGFGYAIPNMEEWTYEVGSTLYDMPIIPKVYTFDSSDYENITVRFEYDAEYEENWAEYINGEHISYEWTTADLLSTFGIDITSDPLDVEYIEITFRPARQCNWEQFNPIDETKFATASDMATAQSDITTLKNWCVKTITGGVNLNNYTNEGWYKFVGAPITNTPTAVSTGFTMLVIKNGIYIKQFIFAQHVTSTVGGYGYGNYAPSIFHRCYVSNAWYSWQTVYSGDCANFISGFDSSKKQKLVHSSNTPSLSWVEDIPLNVTDITGYNASATQVLSHDSSGNLVWITQ